MPQMQGNALEISLDFHFGPIPAIFSAHVPAIYSVRKTVDRAMKEGSTVNLRTIDLSKAFDKVNHHALYIQESPAVADKPARRLRNVCTVYVRAVGLYSWVAYR